MNAKEIANSLDEIATLLELRGDNPFRIRAFSNASRVLRSTDLDLEVFIESAKDKKIKGIGPALTENIEAFYQDGELDFLNDLRDEFPDGLLEILELPGLGAKKVKVLYRDLKVESIDELKTVCENGKLAELKGFSEKTATNILDSIERHKTFSGQFLYRDAYAAALPVLEQLKKSKLTDSIEIAGSLRRGKEVVKDIDIIASTAAANKLMDFFTQLEEVDKVTSKGETKSAIILKSGISVDLRVVPKKDFASALLHFTGSKEHNTVMRSRAIQRGFKLNEYGLFKGEKAFSLKTEEAYYKKLDLSYVPPERREDLGEIELAEKLAEKDAQFPKAITIKDIKGILHAHSTYSDGANTLEEMAKATKKAGYKYLGITDHSQTAAYAGGLKPKEISKQHDEIDKLNEQLAPFRIFKGIESDILTKGELDYKEKVLENFDFIIASVHSQFNLAEAAMTERFINAIKNPYTTIIGHITGRLLLKRDGYAVNVPKVLEACAEYGVAIEINANPKRLDLDWRYLNLAKRLGIKIPICPDAHSIEGISNVAYGVVTARKGGLEKKDVPNCWTLAKLEKFFEERSC